MQHGAQMTVFCCADLEFQKGHNKAVDGQGMVNTLLELVAQQLKVSNFKHLCCVMHGLWHNQLCVACVTQVMTNGSTCTVFCLTVNSRDLWCSLVPTTPLPFCRVVRNEKFSITFEAQCFCVTYICKE